MVIYNEYFSFSVSVTKIIGTL